LSRLERVVPDVPVKVYDGIEEEEDEPSLLIADDEDFLRPSEAAEEIKQDNEYVVSKSDRESQQKQKTAAQRRKSAEPAHLVSSPEKELHEGDSVLCFSSKSGQWVKAQVMSTSDTPPREYMPLDNIKRDNIDTPSRKLIPRPPVEPARYSSSSSTDQDKYRRPSFRGSTHRPPPGLDDDDDNDDDIDYEKQERFLPRPPLQAPDDAPPPGLWKRQNVKKEKKIIKDDAVPPGLWKRETRDDVATALSDDIRPINDDEGPPSPPASPPKLLVDDVEPPIVSDDEEVPVDDGVAMLSPLRAENDDEDMSRSDSPTRMKREYTAHSLVKKVLGYVIFEINTSLSLPLSLTHTQTHALTLSIHTVTQIKTQHDYSIIST